MGGPSNIVSILLFSFCFVDCAGRRQGTYKKGSYIKWLSLCSGVLAGE